MEYANGLPLVCHWFASGLPLPLGRFLESLGLGWGLGVGVGCGQALIRHPRPRCGQALIRNTLGLPCALATDMCLHACVREHGLASFVLEACPV